MPSAAFMLQKGLLVSRSMAFCSKNEKPSQAP